MQLDILIFHALIFMYVIVAGFEDIDGIFLAVEEVICINFIESSLSIIKLAIYLLYAEYA